MQRHCTRNGMESIAICAEDRKKTPSKSLFNLYCFLVKHTRLCYCLFINTRSQSGVKSPPSKEPHKLHSGVEIIIIKNTKVIVSNRESIVNARTNYN